MNVTCKRALAVGLLALAFGGCSFKLVMPPPPPSEWPSAPTNVAPLERCTSSPFPPMVDTGAAVVLDTLAIVERNAKTQVTPIIFAAASLPVIASAIYGFVVSAECRRYQRLFETNPNQ